MPFAILQRQFLLFIETIISYKEKTWKDSKKILKSKNGLEKVIKHGISFIRSTKVSDKHILKKPNILQQRLKEIEIEKEKRN